MPLVLPALVPDWASNDDYSAGPDIGTPTKVDPATQANGFIRGTVAAAQHVNYLVNQMTTGYNQHVAGVNRALQIAALHLLVLQATMTDTDESMAATMVDGITDPTAGALLVKADASDAILAYDGPEVDVQGSIASITSLVREAATDGTRVVVIGVGGNGNSYSDNAGGTWSAGGAGIATATPFYLVYAPPNALANGGDTFLAGGDDSGAVSRSVDAATIWASAASGFAGVRGLAVLGGATANQGYIVSLGNSGIEPRFSLSTDGDGTSFTGSFSPPSAATAEEPGSIAGAPLVDGVGDAVYHIMRCNAGARIRTALSVDGSTWTSGTTIEAPTGATFVSQPRLMICKSTGLMVIAAPLDNGTTALYASTDFVTWVGPTTVKDITVLAFAVAAGRLFMTRDAFMYASAGVGRT
jgi:hypothetical protein